MIDDPQQIGDFDTVLTRWIDGNPVCRSVDNFDMRKFKGIKPVYLTATHKVYPDPDQNWDDLENIVMQSWQDHYDAPMPAEERQSLLETLGKSTPEEPTYFAARDNTSVTVRKYKENLPVGYIVNDNDRNYLFSLGNSRHTNTRNITLKDLYKKGIQWIFPKANNFIPMDSISPTIKEHPGVLHVNAKDLYEFANGRDMLEYGSGKSGDWKIQPKGGNGYMLAEINGLPYWVDILGQIPYAIDAYRHYYSSFLNNDKRKKAELTGNFSELDIPKGVFPDPFSLNEKKLTKLTGKIFGGGTFLSVDNSKSTDNEMINRATEWYENVMLPHEWRRWKNRTENDIDSTKYFLNGLIDYESDFKKNKR